MSFRAVPVLARVFRLAALGTRALRLAGRLSARIAVRVLRATRHTVACLVPLSTRTLIRTTARIAAPTLLTTGAAMLSRRFRTLCRLYSTAPRRFAASSALRAGAFASSALPRIPLFHESAYLCAWPDAISNGMGSS